MGPLLQFAGNDFFQMSDFLDYQSIYVCMHAGLVDYSGLFAILGNYSYLEVLGPLGQWSIVPLAPRESF